MSQTESIEFRISSAVNQNAALSQEGMLERLFGRLFHGLVYPQIWEDPIADMNALEIASDDHIVCIASGGCNMMSYLCSSPASIVAVDLSPAHVALNRLKLTAAQHLPDQLSFYDFFGHANRRDNIDKFDRYIASNLDTMTQEYWNGRSTFGKRKRLFSRGFYRYGLLGRFIGVVHLIARLKGVDFQPLLEARSLTEQEQFFNQEIAPLYESHLVQFLARRPASLFGLGIPPAQFDKLAADAEGDIVAVLRERTRKLFCDYPISENYFAWQAAYRGYDPSGTGPVPPYLLAENFDTIRANADRVVVLNQAMTEMLANQLDCSKSVYVLLDAQDWMSDEQLNALWAEITRTAKPGARVLFRTGGSDDILPGRVAAPLLNQWVYDKAKSKEATLQDRSAIYGGVHLYQLRGDQA